MVACVKPIQCTMRTADTGLCTDDPTTALGVGIGSARLPQNENDLSRVFEDEKILITIESMPWRGLTVRAG